jgi:hypothetical protein
MKGYNKVVNARIIEGSDGVYTMYFKLEPIPSMADVDVPEWMTPMQTEAVNKLYDRDPDGSLSLKNFYSRVKYCFGNYCGIEWCGMFIGIESDGYTHS